MAWGQHGRDRPHGEDELDLTGRGCMLESHGQADGTGGWGQMVKGPNIRAEGLDLMEKDRAFEEPA